VVGFGGIAVVIQYHIGSIRLYFDLRALIGQLIWIVLDRFLAVIALIWCNVEGDTICVGIRIAEIDILPVKKIEIAD
jgi:hypothetical protein